MLYIQILGVRINKLTNKPPLSCSNSDRHILILWGQIETGNRCIYILCLFPLLLAFTPSHVQAGVWTIFYMLFFIIHWMVLCLPSHCPKIYSPAWALSLYMTTVLSFLRPEFSIDHLYIFSAVFFNCVHCFVQAWVCLHYYHSRTPPGATFGDHL